MNDNLSRAKVLGFFLELEAKLLKSASDLQGHFTSQFYKDRAAEIRAIITEIESGEFAASVCEYEDSEYKCNRILATEEEIKIGFCNECFEYIHGEFDPEPEPENIFAGMTDEQVQAGADNWKSLLENKPDKAGGNSCEICRNCFHGSDCAVEGKACDLWRSK